MDPTLIPRLAREAGIDLLPGERDTGEIACFYEAWPEQLTRFAALVAERCAQTIDACARMSAATGNLERAQAIADSAALIRGSSRSSHDLRTHLLPVDQYAAQ